MILSVGIVYLITYPNGKIYVGQDRTDDINYFGSADSFTIAADFPDKPAEFVIKKRILARIERISIKDLNQVEAEFIREYRSNDPAIGYNRTGSARRHCKTLIAGVL